MADLAELLMMEHASIRVISFSSHGMDSLDNFVVFNNYLKNVHIDVEEKILFPLVVDFDWADRKEFEATVNRIKSDHRLIETLAENLIKWKESGKEELIALRLPLFYKTLTDHNNSEEGQIFPRWVYLDSENTRSALREALSVIESNSEELYEKVTGISHDLLDYIRKR